ncbi:hypothetical protein Q5P01_007502 [Channa striata]|uniref:Uncharacterized protein n=1 Tax=Channa striata TaxID=64152 RepID=A0AA88N8G6_CHASR|nr:hypothetical protein Q5P01_007502 [Channa striata]
MSSWSCKHTPVLQAASLNIAGKFTFSGCTKWNLLTEDFIVLSRCQWGCTSRQLVMKVKRVMLTLAANLQRQPENIQFFSIDSSTNAN